MSEKFVFASNLKNEQEQNMIKILLKHVIDNNIFSNRFRDGVIVFLNEEDEIITKALKLLNSKLFLIPAWMKLSDEVENEILLAKKQGIEVRAFSHWIQDDIPEILDCLGQEKTPMWNTDIFAYWKNFK